VAEALERLFPERVEQWLGLLARHWERAGEASKATDYLLRAGDKARLMYAHTEAADYYERALELLKEDGQLGQAARTLMKMGLTYHTAFEALSPGLRGGVCPVAAGGEDAADSLASCATRPPNSLAQSEYSGSGHG
jgi:hypothetical protein